MISEKPNGVGAGGIFLAFLGGALAGTAAALLLAPRSGAEARAAIGEAVDHTGDRVRRARMAAREAAAAAKEAFTDAMRSEH